MNGLLVDAKDVEVKVEEAADVSLSKNEEPVSVPEPSGTEADSSKDTAADVVKPEEVRTVVFTAMLSTLTLYATYDRTLR